MAMKRCGVCQGQYRTGGGMVYTDKGGELVRVRACGPCAKRSITLVFGSPAPTCACGQAATAHYCGGCLTSKARAPSFDAKAYAKRLRALAALHQASPLPSTAERDDFIAGKVEGLEAAATLLESGR